MSNTQKNLVELIQQNVKQHSESGCCGQLFTLDREEVAAIEETETASVDPFQHMAADYFASGESVIYYAPRTNDRKTVEQSLPEGISIPDWFPANAVGYLKDYGPEGEELGEALEREGVDFERVEAGDEAAFLLFAPDEIALPSKRYAVVSESGEDGILEVDFFGRVTAAYWAQAPEEESAIRDENAPLEDFDLDGWRSEPDEENGWQLFSEIKGLSILRAE